MWQPGSLEFDEMEGNIVLKDADDIVVAGPIYKYFTTAGGDNVRAVDVENGRLFAAAPDLLAALTELLSCVEGRLDCMDYNRDEVLAAIKKAETGDE